MAEKEYVLGTGADELSRLGIQHRVWADATVAAWKRAGIGPGSHVLDLGSGPGHATFDLCQMVTESGRVVAFDESKNFVDYLNGQSHARGLTQLSATVGDAQNITASVSKLSVENFDAVYCRWVLCWLREPQRTLEGVAKILKPGGRVVIHDYFHWETMTMGPRSAAVEKMVQAALASFHDRHANMDIAADLPALFEKTGFRLTHFEVYQRVARGGGVDSTLAWILTWWRTYGPKLVTLGKLSAADCEAALNDLAELERNPNKFFFCPPLFELIAERA
jgi:ubiquinone/menaquinone biosynthesis C-methylase UbiE